MARGLLLAIMFITALVPAGAAQDTEGQGPGLGLWLGAGFGAGLGKVGCDVCRGDWEFAPSAQVSFGGTVNSILRDIIEQRIDVLVENVKNKDPRVVKETMTNTITLMRVSVDIDDSFVIRNQFAMPKRCNGDGDIVVD